MIWEQMLMPSFIGKSEVEFPCYTFLFNFQIHLRAGSECHQACAAQRKEKRISSVSNVKHYELMNITCPRPFKSSLDTFPQSISVPCSLPKYRKMNALTLLEVMFNFLHKYWVIDLCVLATLMVSRNPSMCPWVNLQKYHLQAVLLMFSSFLDIYVITIVVCLHSGIFNHSV